MKIDCHKRYLGLNFLSCLSIQKVIAGFGLLFLLFFWQNTAQSANVNSPIIQWAENLESDVAGYKVYQGSTSGSYGYPIDVGNVTTFTVPNLQVGITYYFAITAYDSRGNESPPSSEFSLQLGDSSIPNQSVLYAHEFSNP